VAARSLKVVAMDRDDHIVTCRFGVNVIRFAASTLTSAEQVASAFVDVA
jgi:hypothetical protein